MKKLMSVMLGLTLIVAVAAPSFAADGTDTKKEEKKKGKKKKDAEPK